MLSDKEVKHLSFPLVKATKDGLLRYGIRVTFDTCGDENHEELARLPEKVVLYLFPNYEVIKKDAKQSNVRPQAPFCTSYHIDTLFYLKPRL